MQFMMLMIPNVYRDNRKLEGFAPGLQPLNAGARVSFGKGKPTSGRSAAPPTKAM